MQVSQQIFEGENTDEIENIMTSIHTNISTMQPAYIYVHKPKEHGKISFVG